MHEGVFHMFLIEEVSLAKHNCASLGREPARPGEVTRHARHVGRRTVYASELEVFEHKLYWWTYITRERTTYSEQDMTYCSSTVPFSIARSYGG